MIETNIYCIGNKCNKKLTEADLFYKGRLCRVCGMQEFIVIRAFNLMSFDEFKIYEYERTNTIVRVENNKFVCIPLNSPNGNRFLLGIHSRQLVYLKNKFYKKPIENFDLPF